MDAELQTLPIIDWNIGLKLAGNNQELANDLLALLIKNLPTDIANIEAAHATNNEVELRKHLHKLRGGVSYCGLPRLRAILLAIEFSFKKRELQDLGDLIAQLNQEMALLLSHYKP